jgi:hypothetical protein
MYIISEHKSPYGEVQSKKLHEVEGKELYHVKLTNRFPALETSDTEVDVNKTWGNY